MHTQEQALQPGERFAEAYRQYGAMLYRIAIVHLGNKNDAEEAVQEAFMKLWHKAPAFREQEHEKAWLIRVLTNVCRNMHRNLWFRRKVGTPDVDVHYDRTEDRELLESVLRLPMKYKAAIHLFYYEDYSVKRIGDTLSLSESAVKMRLQRGRQLLRMELDGEPQ